jgi:hypothetical protein
VQRARDIQIKLMMHNPHRLLSDRFAYQQNGFSSRSGSLALCKIAARVEIVGLRMRQGTTSTFDLMYWHKIGQ